jgi:hypothetical protein
MKTSPTPTLAELERAAVHEARAALAGREECLCRICLKVEAAFAAEQQKSRSV